MLLPTMRGTVRLGLLCLTPSHRTRARGSGGEAEGLARRRHECSVGGRVLDGVTDTSWGISLRLWVVAKGDEAHVKVLATVSKNDEILSRSFGGRGGTLEVQE